MNAISKRQVIKATNSDVPIILVVEDEPDNLLLICHILIYLNYNFICAKKGQDALDLATNYDIDLVLLDLVLPDINGFEIVNRLKKHIATRNMPVVAVSALVQPRERDRALAAGCDDYLRKPYLINDLKRKIKQHLPSSFFE